MEKKRRPHGYWKNKERCMESAKRYQTRNNWQEGEPSAYRSALREGWLDEFFPESKGKNKKITDEQYRDLLALHRPEVRAIEPYVDNGTPILHQCAIDDHEWLAPPANIKRGHGCPACDARRRGRKIKGHWTLEMCLDSARQHQNQRDWRAANESAYYAAKKKGWLAQCTAHMEKLVRDRRTDEELLADAQKYRTRADWYRESQSAYAASRKRGHEFHEQACAHMERESGQDNDAVYVWEILDALGPTGIYKVGLTSWKLEDQRIKEVAGQCDLDYRLVALCKTSEGDARIFEDFIKDLGTPFTDVPDDFDGKTELRRFSPEAINTVHQLLGVEEVTIETTQ